MELPSAASTDEIPARREGERTRRREGRESRGRKGTNMAVETRFFGAWSREGTGRVVGGSREGGASGRTWAEVGRRDTEA